MRQNPDTASLYAYAADNPVNNIDPTGAFDYACANKMIIENIVAGAVLRTVMGSV